MRTDDLMDLLRSRFSPPAYAFLTNVGIATGMACDRWADAMAMGLWPSRGLRLHGFELKVSRTDWLRELKKPSKAEKHVRYCDHWWLVVSDAEIVKDGELPPTWGLIAAKGGKLHTKVEAPALEPEPISRKFLAAICRRVSEQSAREDEIEKARLAGYKQGEEANERRRSYDQKRHEDLQRKVVEFEQASGVNLQYGWQLGKVGEAVKMIVDGQRPLDKVASIRNLASRLIQEIDKSMEEVVKQ